MNRKNKMIASFTVICTLIIIFLLYYLSFYVPLKITQAYYDAKECLDKNEKVMVVLLDGFSYDEYIEAKNKNKIPFLENFYKGKALSVYKPVTNAGFAAIITGQPPIKNGVFDRSFRELKTESIFAYAQRKNKKSILLEADIKILNTEIEPHLHLDENKNGNIDDEIFNDAMEASISDYDLIFIHFHGIDDRGHSFGPNSEETLNYINKIDSYIKNINAVWGNTIILTADHGMHEEGVGGSHGKFIKEDMNVPYFKVIP